MAYDFTFNEKLKFSWGHIISIIALVFIAYCTFVGMVYLLKGLFLLSAIITAVITLLMAILFFVPQQLKATDRKFYKRIKWERGFIFASPILFVILMVPFAHAWTVHHRQSHIIDSFNNVVNSVYGMYDDYEVYSHVREINYRYTLGLSDSTTQISLSDNNKMEILHLVLLSSNYDSLKNVSKTWMDKSISKETSTWNVFLLGNIKEIREAIHSWYDDLQTFSKTKLSEEVDVKFFDNSSQYINELDRQIDEIEADYTNIKGFSPFTLLWILLGYAMLIFPYLIQSRHTKTTGLNLKLFNFSEGKAEIVQEEVEKKKKNKENINNGYTESSGSSNENTCENKKSPIKNSDHETFESFKI